MEGFKYGEYVEKTDYEVRFFYDASGGFAFPCDKDGNLKITENTNPAAIENYKWCLGNEEKFKWDFNRVVPIHRRWRENNSGICYCGKRIELYNEYLGACECPHCGQWWNLNGQALNPVETWSSGDDW